MEVELGKLVQDIWSASGSVGGTVRLYANPSAIIGFLPERLRDFMERYPDVSIELVEHRTQDVIRAVLDDRADIGVGVASGVSKGLESWHFASDPLIVLMPTGHELATRKDIRFLDVLESGLVGVKAGGSLEQTLMERAEAARVAFKPKITVANFDAACRMVEAGLGVAIVPTSAATAFAGTSRFVRRELDEPWAQRELRLYAPRKQPMPRAADALISLLRR